ncbi:MAG TPA: NUDIX domain-containing protein [Prolixibacteraceae bacterium]|nr:NUDIX domain-containing protein [Prolixibacteraceae bacterium]
MYEVFLNERRLLLADRCDRPFLDKKVRMEGNISAETSGEVAPGNHTEGSVYPGKMEAANLRNKVMEVTSREKMEEMVTRFREEEDGVQGDIPDPLVLCGNLPRLWKWFTGMFRLMPAAGGLVHSPRGFLFIFRKGRWDLPKGKIDRGETPLQAALREVSEETGLTRLKAGPALPSTFHLYLSDYPGKPRQWILKETHWFVMEASGREPTRPGTGEEIEEVRWLQPSESGLILANTYASLREMIRLACRL